MTRVSCFSLGLLALGVGLAGCGTTAVRPNGPVDLTGLGERHAVTVRFAFNAGRVRALAVPDAAGFVGVPRGVDEAELRVYGRANATAPFARVPLDERGTVVRPGDGVRLVLSAAASSATLSLPSGLDYRIEVLGYNTAAPANAGGLNVPAAFGTATVTGLKDEASVAPVMQPLLGAGSARFDPPAGPYLAGHSLPFALKVLAQDSASVVPGAGFGYAPYALDDASDSTLPEGRSSAHGVLVTFGLVSGTTVSTTVTGVEQPLNQDPDAGPSADPGLVDLPVSTSVSLETASFDVTGDLAAPTLDGSVGFADGILSVPAADVGSGLRHLDVIGPDGVSLVGTETLDADPAPGSFTFLTPLTGVEPGDALTLYLSDAAGNEAVFPVAAAAPAQ